MQGGLDNDIQRKDILEYLEARPEASAREIISQWLTEPLCYEPGTRFVYSMSFDVLGATGNRILTRESLTAHTCKDRSFHGDMERVFEGFLPDRADYGNPGSVKKVSAEYQNMYGILFEKQYVSLSYETHHSTSRPSGSPQSYSV